MPNTIDDLRSHLFETLAALKDKETPMELDRARAVADVARVLVDSAKVEVEFLKVTGATRSTGFLPQDSTPPATSKRAPGRLTPGEHALHEGVLGPLAAADKCGLCGVRLTTPYLIEQGFCGSCSERPEAKHLKPVAGARR
jgi:hypothetical protein